MKKIMVTLALLTANTVVAKELNTKLADVCEQKIVDVVTDELGRKDETFGVVGYKVIYSAFLTDLAIVRTTDENEPRDVLVNVNFLNSESKCTVKYLETVADGSVSDIDDELVLVDYKPAPVKHPTVFIAGQITDVVVGEFDPYTVGDACVVEIKTAKNEIVGLFTDYDMCLDKKDQVKAGVSFKFNIEKREQIKDKKTISVLKKVVKAKRFYEIKFEDIQKGLAQ